MTIKFAAVTRDVGRFLLIPAVMALLSLPVCVLSGDWFAVAPFAITSLSAFATSYLFFQLGVKAKDSSLRQTLVTVALGWGIVFLFGALPLWLSALFVGAEATPTLANFSNGLNALFESVAGYTSAGLTMTGRASQLPVSLQWWRSFMQWVGGVGVVVLAISLMEPTHSTYRLYQAEGRENRIQITATQTVRRIWLIYIGLTGLSVLLFRAVGMPWWAALNHAMTAISTGGFSITDNSMGAYSSPVQLAVILVMVLGAIAFSSHYNIVKRRKLSAIWLDHQNQLLAILLVIGTGAVAFYKYAAIGSFNWVDSAFQWASALTTCGLSSQSLQFWSSGNKLMLSVAMIIGGAAGSTVGGIKLKRALTLGKATLWNFQRATLSPRQLLVRRLNDDLLTLEEANQQLEEAAVLMFLWILSLFVAVLILLLIVPSKYLLSDIIFEAASALGTAGLTTGITGPSLHWAGKGVLMFLMWIGRLEIIPVFMLLLVPWERLLRR